MSQLTPLYRLQGHGDHFYTTSADERDRAVAEYGYTSEGIACYVHETGTEDTATIRDDLAGRAMAAIVGLAYLTGARPKPTEAAETAYEYADAMLAARVK